MVNKQVLDSKPVPILTYLNTNKDYLDPDPIFTVLRKKPMEGYEYAQKLWRPLGWFDLLFGLGANDRIIACGLNNC